MGEGTLLGRRGFLGDACCKRCKAFVVAFPIRYLLLQECRSCFYRSSVMLPGKDNEIYEILFFAALTILALPTSLNQYIYIYIYP
ncbi:hypothetical protein BDV10DRAFT_165916 [Aspergillus recurvatus]